MISNILKILILLFLTSCGNNNSNKNYQENNQSSTNIQNKQPQKNGHNIITIFYNYPSDICIKDKLFPKPTYSDSYRDDITVTIENINVSCMDFDDNDICREDTTYIDVGIDNDNLACVVSIYYEGS